MITEHDTPSRMAHEEDRKPVLETHHEAPDTHHETFQAGTAQGNFVVQETHALTHFVQAINNPWSAVVAVFIIWMVAQFFLNKKNPINVGKRIDRLYSSLNGFGKDTDGNEITISDFIKKNYQIEKKNSEDLQKIKRALIRIHKKIDDIV